jgi:hypothetical protein
VLGVDPAAPEPGEPARRQARGGRRRRGLRDHPRRRDRQLQPLHQPQGRQHDGGAPNVDDFDGDGFPEIGTALGTRYVMLDLQAPPPRAPRGRTVFTDAQIGPAGQSGARPRRRVHAWTPTARGRRLQQDPGQCVCLHNGWQRVTEDDSSRVTSSSVFDFNGDGAAEVVYNDECFFRIYDGITADVLFKNNSPSRTRIENPVIADVDNDGNAEIVFPSNNDANSLLLGGRQLPERRRRVGRRQRLLGERAPHLEPARLPRDQRPRAARSPRS